MKEKFIEYATQAIKLLKPGKMTMCLPEVEKLVEKTYEQLTPDEKKEVATLWRDYQWYKIIPLFGEFPGKNEVLLEALKDYYQKECLTLSVLAAGDHVWEEAEVQKHWANLQEAERLYKENGGEEDLTDVPVQTAFSHLDPDDIEWVGDDDDE